MRKIIILLVVIALMTPAAALAQKPGPVEPGRTWIPWPPWDDEAEKLLNNLTDNPDAYTGDGLQRHINALTALFSPFDVAAPLGHINENDVGLVVLHFGFKAGKPGYWYLFDYNGDDVIDIIDLAQVTSRFGCSIMDRCYW